MLFSEAGRQLTWLLLLVVSAAFFQAGLGLVIAGWRLHETISDHNFVFRSYGEPTIDLTIAGLWAVNFPLLTGLLVIKSSLFVIITAMLARELRVNRKMVSDLAFACCLFELLQLLWMWLGAILFPIFMRAFFQSFRESFPRALVQGYMHNASLTAYVNDIQYDFQCCGITDYQDWFVIDWLDLEWMQNRYPSVLYYRDSVYHVMNYLKTDKYPFWAESFRKSYYGESTPTRLAYLLDRLNNKTDNFFIKKYVETTSFSEVPPSCCQPDSETFTWCVRQYVEFDSYGYKFPDNSTIHLQGCVARVKEVLGGRIVGLSVLISMLALVRLPVLALMRLVQTSGAQAVRSGDHLKSAHGYIFSKPKDLEESTSSLKLTEYNLTQHQVDNDEMKPLHRQKDSKQPTRLSKSEGNSTQDQNDNTTTVSEDTDTEEPEITESLSSDTISTNTVSRISTIDNLSSSQVTDTAADFSVSTTTVQPSQTTVVEAEQ